MKRRKSKPRVVVIGGGTGTFTVLTGLKKYTPNLTAIVSMADSGGSTGRLRDEFGILPPGDVRRALLALSSGPEQLMLRRLFDYRFENGHGLSGHSFGNLFLTALTKIVGSEVGAIEEAGRLLNIRGRVLPVTLTNTHLIARLEDGTLIRGETNIDIRLVRPELKILDVFLDPPAQIFADAAKQIENADVVVVGPGDLYTSVIANLLVAGASEAICKTKGKVVYVCNIMNKHGETDGFTASDYVCEVAKYLALKGLTFQGWRGAGVGIDCVVVNSGSYPKRLLYNYGREKAYPVSADVGAVRKLVPQVIVDDFTTKDTLLRHDPDKLAKAILTLA